MVIIVIVIVIVKIIRDIKLDPLLESDQNYLVVSSLREKMHTNPLLSGQCQTLHSQFMVALLILDTHGLPDLSERLSFDSTSTRDPELTLAAARMFQRLKWSVWPEGTRLADGSGVTAQVAFSSEPLSCMTRKKKENCSFTPALPFSEQSAPNSQIATASIFSSQGPNRKKFQDGRDLRLDLAESNRHCQRWKLATSNRNVLSWKRAPETAEISGLWWKLAIAKIAVSLRSETETPAPQLTTPFLKLWVRQLIDMDTGPQTIS